MATFKSGALYAADIKLDLTELGYSNEVLANLLETIGFSEVEVTGGGTVRHVRARWPRADAEKELPDQVRNFREVV